MTNGLPIIVLAMIFSCSARAKDCPCGAQKTSLEELDQYNQFNFCLLGFNVMGVQSFGQVIDKFLFYNYLHPVSDCVTIQQQLEGCESKLCGYNKQQNCKRVYASIALTFHVKMGDWLTYCYFYVARWESVISSQ